MPIESLLQAVVDALKENTAALGGGKASSGKAAADKAPADKPASSRSKAAAAKDDDDDAPDYEKDVKPLLKGVSEACGREDLVAMFKSFGVTKGDQLEEEDYPAVIKKCKKLIADAV